MNQLTRLFSLGVLGWKLLLLASAYVQEQRAAKKGLTFPSVDFSLLSQNNSTSNSGIWFPLGDSLLS